MRRTRLPLTLVFLVGGSAQGELVSVIGGTLRVNNPANSTPVTVTAKFLGDASSLYTNELYLDAPTFVGPIFNNKTTPLNATVPIGTYQPETVLFIRDQAYFYPHPEIPGSPASYNYAFFTGDGSLPLNPDHLPHAVLTYDRTDPSVPVKVGFEDQIGGGDVDFNDAVYSFSNCRVGVVEVAVTPMNIPFGEEVINHETAHFAGLHHEFSNHGTLHNDGSLFNYGTGENDGVLENLSSLFNDLPGTLNNGAAGQINNQGTIRNFGITNNAGIFSSIGTVSNGGTVMNTGTLVSTVISVLGNLDTGAIANIGTMLLEGAANNSGTVSNGGLMRNVGNILNQAAGTISNNGTGVIENIGTILNSANATVTNQGTIGTSGVFQNIGTITNQAGGIFNNQATGALENIGTFVNSQASSTTNNGSITNSGTIQNSGAVIIEASGAVENAISGAIQNTGNWLNKSGSQTDNSGTIANSGSYQIDSGASVTGDGTFTQLGDAMTTINGVMSQSIVNIQSGVLNGAGSIEGFLKAGADATVSPGNSPGTLTVDGDFTLSGGTLKIELASPNSTDLLDITGAATFQGGTVNCAFSFVPPIGDALVFLTAAGGITGDETLHLNAINNPANLDFTSFLLGNNLYVVALGVSSRIPGDANHDNIVNTLDFDVLAANFNQTTALFWANGDVLADFNADGLINALDFNALATHYGASPSLPLGSAVPEPSAMAVIGIGGLGIRRRRKILAAVPLHWH